MSDQEFDQNDENGEDGNEPVVRMSRKDIRALEAKARKNDEDAAELATAKRELAFHKAGVDLESKAGQLLLKSWDGDLDVEAIKAEAGELNALTSGKAPAADSGDDGERQSTDERSALGTGAGADEHQTPTPDPVKGAVELGFAALKEGKSEEAALGAVFEHLARAAEGGDTRVIWDPTKL